MDLDSLIERKVEEMPTSAVIPARRIYISVRVGYGQSALTKKEKVPRARGKISDGTRKAYPRKKRTLEQIVRYKDHIYF